MLFWDMLTINLFVVEVWVFVDPKMYSLKLWASYQAAIYNELGVKHICYIRKHDQ